MTPEAKTIMKGLDRRLSVCPGNWYPAERERGGKHPIAGLLCGEQCQLDSKVRPEGVQQ